jgi:IS5 family transposase
MALIKLIEPHYPKGKTRRPPFSVATMLHVHFAAKVWFVRPGHGSSVLSVSLYREFAGLGGDEMTRLPDETTILRVRHLIETHDLAAKMWRS